jgi:two-component system chemotaxis response regulator CheB
MMHDDTCRCRLVVIGASQGGLVAVQRLLGQLPGTFALPLVLVLHRGRRMGGLLPDLLQTSSALEVVEAEDKTPLAGGKLYVAPADYHLLVEGSHLALSTETPVNHARPSIDVLFESAAYAAAQRLIALLLTGGGSDGVKGLLAVKKHGGYIVVQDPQDAENAALPTAALAAVEADAVLSMEKIARYINI